MRVLAWALLAGLLLCGCSHGSNAVAQKPRRPHVVLIVFDEFGGDILLGPHGRIDAGRYPHFAALARDGTWFRNAQSSYDSTTKAVPLILDGIAPQPRASPNARDHPHSIFTALGRRGYRILTSEEATAMCPRRYCPHERPRRPAIIPNLLAGRAKRFRDFVASIRASRRPTLWMKHALLPHGPWVYMPSGVRTRRPRGRELIPGMQTIPGFYDDYLRHHNEQRQLLQLAFADRLLGELVARLKSQGMYDDTLVVVTADHGFAWKLGVETRRSVSLSNIDELGSVPMIVKRPGGHAGEVNGTLARTLDVTPTIADLLNIPLGYRADGRSMFSRGVRARRTVSMVKRDFSAIVRLPFGEWRARRAAVVRRRLRELGSGDWPSLYTASGPHRELIGRRVGRVRRVSAVRATLALPRAFAQVRRRSGIVPCQVAGRIRGSGRGRERDIAVAVNGRIEAVGRSFHLRGERVESYSVMVPEDSLGEGRNRVEVLEVGRGGALALLARS